MALKFVRNILDDVHGLIPITAIEKEIINTRLFRRLQDIKQLSLTHWVFPGSEHTRYSHSLGVMHLIDKMALALNFSDEDRQIARLAGLLHDVGHYPLSHVGEHAYSKEILTYTQMKNMFDNTIDSMYKSIQEKVKKISKNKVQIDFLTFNTNKFHHEKVSSKIATENKDIQEIIKKYLNDPNFVIKKDIMELNNEINQMINGYVDKDTNDWLCVKIQLLHSEFDADRLDYLLRDSKSSGTSYGTVDIDYLISNLKIGKFCDRSIVGIAKRAINAADQFMINRFFSYTNVIFNDKVSFLGEIAEMLIVYFASKGKGILLNREIFETEILDNKKLVEKNIAEAFYTFNDVSFWNAIYSKEEDFYPDFIRKIKKILLEKKSVKCVDETELRLITGRVKEFIDEYQKTIDNFDKNNFPVLISYQMTKHVPLKKFKEILEANKKKNKNYDVDDKLLRRLYDGLTVIDDNDCHLLIDDAQSMIRNCWDTTLYCLREYEID